MDQLAGKVAVITGAASGIGRGLAERFGAEGMKLVLADVESDPLNQLVAELCGRGIEAIGVEVDVADAKAMDALGERCLDRFGAVHLVCNNAGVGSGGRMWELSTADWEFVLGPNLWGVIHGIRVFTRHLIAQNEGHIVNTASMAGLLSVPGLGPYNVSKHGVVTLSETLYGELKAENSAVGVSVLCPGFVHTRIFDFERHHARTGTASHVPEPVRALQNQLHQIASQFMPPQDVAARVLEAVRTRRFYILTHEGPTKEAVRKRLQAITGGEPPAAIDGSVFLSRD